MSRPADSPPDRPRGRHRRRAPRPPRAGEPAARRGRSGHHRSPLQLVRGAAALIAATLASWPAPAAMASPTSSGGGGSASGAFSDLAPWLAILGLIVIVGGVVLLRLRRGIREDDAAPKVGFTLQDLREMHARGELTDEEFTRARDALVAGVRRSADRPASGRDSA